MGVSLSSGGKRNKGRRRKSAPMSEINVTPFVDVMLVLLIIFMVAAPLLTVGVPLNLPETKANSLPVEREAPLTINIAADGTIYLQKEPTSIQALTAKLPAIAVERDGDRVYLRADAALDYGRVAEVMGLLNASGFRSIALVTDSVGGQPNTPPVDEPAEER
ncbi:MAG: ExbD/TolR family protein [Pikeienuella sp.]